MKVVFSKYHGNGNDFILVDNRKNSFPKKDPGLISELCHRRFGIGADGLILLEKSKTALDFSMVYFNSDGKEGSLCGNGGRCITAFARSLGLIRKFVTFSAADGEHHSILLDYSPSVSKVRLRMNDPVLIKSGRDFFFFHTGSPHYVVTHSETDELNVVEEGRKIRYGPEFRKSGTNVDFIRRSRDGVFMRVYERGVEDETYSSGTGAVASALAASLLGWSRKENCIVNTKGGPLKVMFIRKGNSFSDVWLEGPVHKVFAGEVTV